MLILEHGVDILRGEDIRIPLESSEDDIPKTFFYPVSLLGEFIDLPFEQALKQARIKRANSFERFIPTIFVAITKTHTKAEEEETDVQHATRLIREHLEKDPIEIYTPHFNNTMLTIMAVDKIQHMIFNMMHSQIFPLTEEGRSMQDKSRDFSLLSHKEDLMSVHDIVNALINTDAHTIFCLGTALAEAPTGELENLDPEYIESELIGLMLEMFEGLDQRVNEILQVENIYQVP